MKHILCRQGMFETNSSSTHSVVIDRNYLRWKEQAPEDGHLYLESVFPRWENNTFSTEYKVKGGEFGWEWRLYNSLDEKLSYLTTFVKEYSPQHEPFLLEVFKEQTGLDLIFEEMTEEETYHKPWGYIDHQALEDGFINDYFESKEALRLLIFNRAYAIATGNDNEDFGFGAYFDTHE